MMTLLSFTTLPLPVLRRHLITYPRFLSVHPPPPILYNSPLSRVSATLLHDAAATAAALGGAYGLVSSFDALTQRNLIQQSLSRKMVHILSGLLFAMSWPIFSTANEARYFAAVVPFVNCIRLLLHAFSPSSNGPLINSLTRYGNPKELLGGPLFYVIILILCALVFWRDSPVGLISVSMMCGGDGVADIVGRRFGSIKLPYNKNKSWAGSISMFSSGFLISMGMLYYYSNLGYYHLDWTLTMQRVALVALLATVVESLPTAQVLDDNISVPLASMAAAYLSFRY